MNAWPCAPASGEATASARGVRISLATLTPEQRVDLHDLLVEVHAEAVASLRTDIQCTARLSIGGAPREASVDAEDFDIYRLSARAQMLRRIEAITGQSAPEPWLRRAIDDPHWLLAPETPA